MRIANSPFHYSMESAQNWYRPLGLPKYYFGSFWIRDIEAATSALQQLNWAIGEQPLCCDQQCMERGLLLGLAGGGPLISDQELQAIKKLMSSCGEKSFFIIEDAIPKFMTDKTSPPIALEFPFNVDIDQLSAGAATTVDAENGNDLWFRFDNGIGHYFVFGSSGKWGKYVANDLADPYECFTFEKALAQDVCPWYRSLMKPLGPNNRNEIPSDWLEQVGRTEKELALICANDDKRLASRHC